MTKSTVSIQAQSNGRGTVEVDGVDMSGHISSIEVSVAAGSPNQARMALAAPSLDSLVVRDAELQIVGTRLPPAAEEALLDYLLSVYRVADITCMDDEARRYIRIRTEID